MYDPVVYGAAKGKRTRRRRAWYRRRLRMQRILLAVMVGTLVAGACWQNAASYFSAHSWNSSQASSESFWVRGNIHKNLALMAASSAKPAKSIARFPGVYPYSVIPGGVKDPDDLRYAALRDYVVRRHYAHFDYAHAQFLRATEAREVYLSYRIRDTVFWTRRKVRLQPGELLLTDGKITARARCGNQISDTAKPEVSEEEPAEDVLDQPVAAAPSFPVRPMLAAHDLPATVPNSPQLFASGFVFPYVSAGMPVSPPKACPAGEVGIDGHCHHKRHGVTPEPSTLLLITSGLALVLWRYRRTARPVTASSLSS